MLHQRRRRRDARDWNWRTPRHGKALQMRRCASKPLASGNLIKAVAPDDTARRYIQ